MKRMIEELGSLCKMAAEIEKKWDHAGNEFLKARMKRAEYAEIITEYLQAVRRLEAALSHHLTAMNTIVGLKTLDTESAPDIEDA